MFIQQLFVHKLSPPLMVRVLALPYHQLTGAMPRWGRPPPSLAWRDPRARIALAGPRRKAARPSQPLEVKNLKSVWSGVRTRYRCCSTSLLQSSNRRLGCEANSRLIWCVIASISRCQHVEPHSVHDVIRRFQSCWFNSTTLFIVDNPKNVVPCESISEKILVSSICTSLSGWAK